MYSCLMLSIFRIGYNSDQDKVPNEPVMMSPFPKQVQSILGNLYNVHVTDWIGETSAKEHVSSARLWINVILDQMSHVHLYPSTNRIN